MCNDSCNRSFHTHYSQISFEIEFIFAHQKYVGLELAHPRTYKFMFQKPDKTTHATKHLSQHLNPIHLNDTTWHLINVYDWLSDCSLIYLWFRKAFVLCNKALLLQENCIQLLTHPSLTYHMLSWTIGVCRLVAHSVWMLLCSASGDKPFRTNYSQIPFQIQFMLANRKVCWSGTNTRPYVQINIRNTGQDHMHCAIKHLSQHLNPIHLTDTPRHLINVSIFNFMLTKWTQCPRNRTVRILHLQLIFHLNTGVLVLSSWSLWLIIMRMVMDY